MRIKIQFFLLQIVQNLPHLLDWVAMDILFETAPPRKLQTLQSLPSPSKTLLLYDAKLPFTPPQGILPFPLNGGEEAKTFQQLEDLLKFLAKHQFDKSSLLAVLGGGSLSDLGGFAASIYHRGIPLVLIPTTLLAMIDAAIGGKNGVNFGGIKNGTGTIYHPQSVILNPLWLTSLPQNEYRQGLAEAVKYALIEGEPLLNFLEKNIQAIQNQETETLESLIRRCIEIKMEIVRRSENEPEVRELLNLGHTFGHAIEAASHFQIPHGDAVSIGINLALKVSEEKLQFDKNSSRRIQRILEQFGLPTELPSLDREEIIYWMRRDKKNCCGKICLILADKIGNVSRSPDVPLDEVRKVII